MPDEIIILPFSLPTWFIENRTDYRDIDYSYDTVYYTHSCSLKHEPILGSLRLVDAIQDKDGIYIPEAGLIVSLGVTHVYNDSNPHFRTWWKLDDDILYIYNPVSSMYIVEYEYWDIPPGLVSRSSAHFSVHVDSHRIIIPSITLPYGE